MILIKQSPWKDYSPNYQVFVNKIGSKLEAVQKSEVFILRILLLQTLTRFLGPSFSHALPTPQRALRHGKAEEDGSLAVIHMAAKQTNHSTFGNLVPQAACCVGIGQLVNSTKLVIPGASQQRIPQRLTLGRCWLAGLCRHASQGGEYMLSQGHKQHGVHYVGCRTEIPRGPQNLLDFNWLMQEEVGTGESKRNSKEANYFPVLFLSKVLVKSPSQLMSD